MNYKKIIVFLTILGLVFFLTGCSDTYEAPYAQRPRIEVVNWGGRSVDIRFPYKDAKYILDYSNPYEYIVTDAGYDLVIHFGRFERID